jgi:uncharacterized protein (TIGR02001 family)
LTKDHSENTIPKWNIWEPPFAHPSPGKPVIREKTHNMSLRIHVQSVWLQTAFIQIGKAIELVAIFAFVLLSGVGAGAKADELSYYAGVGIVSNYVSNGQTQSKGNPALQAYAEIHKNGFYGGLFFSKVDYRRKDDIVLDMHLGYRTNIDNKLLLDVSYAHYLFDSSGACCGEVKLAAVYRLIDELGIDGFVAYNWRTQEFNRRVGLVYKASDQLNLTASYGKADFIDNRYWKAGMSYAFSEHMSVKVEYNGSQAGNQGLVFGLAIATNQSSVARLLAGQFGR